MTQISKDKQTLLDIAKFFKKEGIKFKLGNPENGIDFILENGSLVKVISSEEEEIDIFEFLKTVKDYEKIFNFKSEDTVYKFYRNVLFIYNKEINKETGKILKDIFNLKRVF